MLRRLKISLAFAVLFVLGLWLPYINLADAGDNSTNRDPTSKEGAEIAALLNPPAFAIDETTSLPKDNTQASCNPGEGNFVCVVSFGEQTATAFVASDGSVTYR